MTAARVSQFWQSNADRRQIFGVVTAAGEQPVASGPLALDQIRKDMLLERLPRNLKADPVLAADLAARAPEFHDLEDFYRFYGYPAEVLAWVEETQINLRDPHGYVSPGGRDLDEVVRRLGLERETPLYAAARAEAVTGLFEPDGHARFHDGFADNWAAGDVTGYVAINPNSYRFKAWLSFNT